MTIRYHKIKRRLVPSDETSEMRVFPVVTYKYGKAADLKEVAKKIAKQSILGEGEVYNMLKYFCSMLQDILLEGRQVNIDGLGYFSLAPFSRLSMQEMMSSLSPCFSRWMRHLLVLTTCFRSMFLSTMWVKESSA